MNFWLRCFSVRVSKRIQWGGCLWKQLLCHNWTYGDLHMTWLWPYKSSYCGCWRYVTANLTYIWPHDLYLSDLYLTSNSFKPLQTSDFCLLLSLARFSPLHSSPLNWRIAMVNNKVNSSKEKPVIVKSYSSTMETNGSLGSAGSHCSVSSSNGNGKSRDVLTARNHSRHENENSAAVGTSTIQQQKLLHQTLSMEDGLTSSTRIMTNGTSNNGAPYQTSLLTWSIYLLLGGIILGLILPKNTSIPSQTWQISSNIIGYTYFLAWSTSFYPQIFLNYHRRTTRGLSVDFCVLNVLGYICYTIYTTNFYWNKHVIAEYKLRRKYGEDGTGGEITVQGNDVAFAIHAIAMASVTLSQIGYFDTFAVRPPSKRIYIVLFCTCTFCIMYIVSTWMYYGQVEILGFLYLLGTIKIGVTIGKYVPQALLNRARKSTVGWNVSSILVKKHATYAVYQWLQFYLCFICASCLKGMECDFGSNGRSLESTAANWRLCCNERLDWNHRQSCKDCIKFGYDMLWCKKVVEFE